MEADVAIVGGGLSGIWCAYQLGKAGKRVILLEAKTIGSGATKATTAFITAALDTDFAELIELYGEKTAKIIWQSGESAINTIEETVDKEKIECDFSRCPAYIYAVNARQFEELEQEKIAAKRIGAHLTLKR